MAKIFGTGPYHFFCPGCKLAHPFDTRFRYNYDSDKPTIYPELICKVGPFPEGHPRHGQEWTCKSFVAKGRITFSKESGHALAGHAADLPDWEDVRQEVIMARLKAKADAMEKENAAGVAEVVP